MTQSQILSKLSRLGLLSVLCTGLFLATGELSMSTDGVVQIGSGGIYNAMAEDPATAKTANSVDTTVNTLATLGNVGIATLTFLITPLIMLAGWLLSPDWTFGDVFLLRPVLHNLWVLVSNVVYVIFGFLLVFVAFANIFGGENAKTYEMKTMLPKLLTGMLMVPFTWFIVSGVLSVTNILTASVIQLPTSNIIGNATFLDKKIVPKDIVYNKSLQDWVWQVDSNGKVLSDADKEATDDKGESILAYKKNWQFYASDCNDDENQCLSIKDILAGGGGAYNLLSVYAYGIFNIQGFKKITPIEWLNAVVDIVIKLGFWVIFFIIFGILVIAIVYALFTRAIMLWLYAMFSPLFALNYVMGDKFKDKGVDKFTIKEFISLAFVPVYVSAALAFGLLFLGAVMGMTGPEDGKFESNVVKVDTETPGEASFTFLGADKTSGVTLTTIGLLDSETSSVAGGVFNKGRSIIGTIIVNTLALVVLWMAVMAALGASKITEAAVKPISEMGGSVGGLMKQAPQYIPIPGMKGQSMGSITKGTTQIAQDIWNIQTTKANEFNQKFGIAKYRELSSAVSAAGMEVQKITKWAKWSDPNVQAAVTKISEAMKKWESMQNLSQQANFRDLIADFGDKIGVTIDKTNLANTTGLTKALNDIESKLDGSGGGGLLWKMGTGTNITRDDYDNFIKTGSGSGGKDETGFAVRDTKSGGINLSIDDSLVEVKLSSDKKSIEFDKDDLEKLKTVAGKFTEEEFRSWFKKTDLWADLTDNLIQKLGDSFKKKEGEKTKTNK